MIANGLRGSNLGSLISTLFIRSKRSKVPPGHQQFKRMNTAISVLDSYLDYSLLTSSAQCLAMLS